MKDDLKYAFGNINDWLKFAEAKNAGILALNAACIIGILQANITFNTGIQWCDKNCFFSGSLIALFIASSAVCLYSIVPTLASKMSPAKKMSAANFQQQQSKLNHLYFGHIAGLTTDQYIDLIKAKFGYTTHTTNGGETDLAAQIVVNSEIALKKFKVFTLASRITLFAAIASIILLSIKVL